MTWLVGFRDRVRAAAELAAPLEVPSWEAAFVLNLIFDANDAITAALKRNALDPERAGEWLRRLVNGIDVPGVTSASEEFDKSLDSIRAAPRFANAPTMPLSPAPLTHAEALAAAAATAPTFPRFAHDPATAPLLAGPRPLSKKQATFIRELREGSKVPEAARAAGINISTGWQWLDEPRIKAAIEARAEAKT